MGYLLSIVLCTISMYGISQGLTYSRVKIYTDQEGLKALSNLGVAIDHGNYNEGKWFISDFSNREIDIMTENGFQTEILIKDVQQYYVDQNKTEDSEKNVGCQALYDGIQVPANFNYGTMAGFYKYQEMLDELDQMAALYPNLITVRQGISTYQTYEGRPIYYVVISDNPSVTETESNILYTAVHHAREPLGMTEVIFYMWYLLENYNTSDEVKFLVDNNQLFFIPCLNPDGYIYNETTNPNGGGMHRKNRRPVGTTNMGVDLNRNYSYQWGTQGISFDPDSDVYCGASAFSEPETQAVKWLAETYGFKAALNAHTYGDLHLFPIGADAAEFADHHDYFNDLATHQVEQNGFVAEKGTSLYPVSGGSDDYLYKEGIGIGMKDTVFSMTPEIGPSFWPNQSLILPNCKKMVHPNLVLAHVPHKYLIVRDNNPSIIEQTTGNFDHTAFRLGLLNGPVTVSIEPLLNIQSVGPAVIHDLALRELAQSSISYTLVAGIQPGDNVKFVINTDYGLWIKRDTITKSFGIAPVQISEDASDLANWTGNWSSTTSTYVSANSSFTDSPSGTYINNANSAFTLDQTIDLTTTDAARVSFYAKWELEPSFDYVQFEVSTDGGTSWIPQCGKYTNSGVGGASGAQPVGEPVYDGFKTDWVLEEIDLSDYVGQIIKVRFLLRSNSSTRYEGFFFDDFNVYYNDLAELNESEIKFSLSPNPGSSQVTLSSINAPQGSQVVIIDQTGRTIKKVEVDQFVPDLKIDVSDLSQGTYNVKYFNGTEWSGMVKFNITR